MIVVDPWLNAGPKTQAAYKDLAALGKVDLLLVTHAHVDHLGDAPAIAKLNNTILYGPAGMVTPLITLGILPPNLGHQFNKSVNTVSVTPRLTLSAECVSILWPECIKPTVHGARSAHPQRTAAVSVNFPAEARPYWFSSSLPRKTY